MQPALQEPSGAGLRRRRKRAHRPRHRKTADAQPNVGSTTDSSSEVYEVQDDQAALAKWKVRLARSKTYAEFLFVSPPSILACQDCGVQRNLCQCVSLGCGCVDRVAGSNPLVAAIGRFFTLLEN